MAKILTEQDLRIAQLERELKRTQATRQSVRRACETAFDLLAAVLTLLSDDPDEVALRHARTTGVVEELELDREEETWTISRVG